MALQKQLIWDLPIRLFHWSLVLGVILSMMIVYGKQYAFLHIGAGTLTAGMLLGRLIWGFAGTRYAVFASFLKGKSDIKAEFAFFTKNEKKHTVGHPALAGWVMLLLILCGLIICASGMLAYMEHNEESKEIFLKWHETFANITLAIAFIHVQGVLLHTITNNDNIVSGMLHGKRPAYENERIDNLTITQKVLASIWLIFAYSLAVVAFLKLQI